MSREKFETFKEYTRQMGYGTWVDGGGSYGSFNEESHEGDPLYYSTNRTPKKDEWKLFYRPSSEELNIIYFNSR